MLAHIKSASVVMFLLLGLSLLVFSMFYNVTKQAEEGTATAQVGEENTNINQVIVHPVPSWKGKFPERLRNLTDLGVIMLSDESAPTKSGVLISWLTKENMTPSKKNLGAGGGDIDSGYIQAQIVRTLADTDNACTMQEVYADVQVKRIIKDAMSIALGRMGDRSQVSNLIKLLKDSKEPDFRALAAKSLGYLGATEAIPELENTLNDQFTRQAGNSMQGNYIAYPVREGAETALLMLRNTDSLSRAQQRCKKFDDKRQEDKQNPPKETIELDTDAFDNTSTK